MHKYNNEPPQRILIGWREWTTLPELDIPSIKAKVDTGARTSALHAFSVEPFMEEGIHMVRFAIHPVQHRTDKVKQCVAKVADERWVTDSGGHREQRLVIRTQLQMAQMVWPIELTLTNRDNMRFRMLLGRTSMENRFSVQPDQSFLLGRPAATQEPGAD